MPGDTPLSDTAIVPNGDPQPLTGNEMLCGLAAGYLTEKEGRADAFEPEVAALGIGYRTMFISGRVAAKNGILFGACLAFFKSQAADALKLVLGLESDSRTPSVEDGKIMFRKVG